ncbi:uncharacterized protein EI97DRAFT_407117 [Westerdykella ornata]|uniref:Chitin-binding type-1 domain-containing protein n=1 Tax=Westerdykella ornata TaxID=318751 RepID=A0A6A6J645_WESOR|nr:uncharacterized protein EI97DRAFT_407117 [Westerdykella ornata]KAF2272051.1 hypothetical protein EI97DRAFT_407117 [Westerdykella ornata]
MRWTRIGLAASISFCGASAALNGNVEAKLSHLAGPHEVRQPNLQALAKRNATTPMLNVLSRFLNRRQAGRCGEEGGGARCPNNECCSSYGWCGDAFERMSPRSYCGEIVGCQPQYGRCGDAPIVTSTPIPSSTPAPSSSSTPVVPSSTSSSSTPPLPSGTLIISPNGQCGNVTTCAGSGFGDCCSEWYFCGSSSAYCGTGCRSAFGRCGGVQPSLSSSQPPIPSSSTSSTRPPTSSPSPTPSSSSTSSSSSRTSSSSSARPTPTVPVSTDGRCGSGISCTGSTFGRCCSDYGWCGNEIEYCSVNWGCQPQWGECGVQ